MINALRYKNRLPLMMHIAWLLPHRLVYFCAIRVIAHATTNQYGNTNPNDLNVMEALKRWTKDHHVKE